MKPMAARELEARSRARSNGVRVHEEVRGNHYTTRSQSTGDTYRLDRTRYGWRCECPGYTYSGVCKHLGQLTRRAEREGWELGRIAPK